ncbi:unnamed protein product [Acanthoscelides obtectus]|uniref:Uncharacterized protein n=1 Tax=Acanthoscelides obtectus TaxID=200917 RepID=A0A9P0MB48_ACAOB|nr:unnamed protein product [Acanthoscelides obtectus]CAK1645892.1 hypothetical protein AOBTE_LOCUS14320 [Acanthoscelides obtectus]
MESEACVKEKILDMEEIEKNIQKNVVNYCKMLPGHVEKWKTLLGQVQKPAKALGNYSEQLRHVECANITYLENFTGIQETLKYRLYCEIEEELNLLKGIIDQLNKSVQDLKNKLSLLERCTLDLNWESNSQLIKGSPIQPPLSLILDKGYEFCLYFSKAMKVINERLKNINVRDEDCMKQFEESFNVSLEEDCVRKCLAIVQYINNEKNLT